MMTDGDAVGGQEWLAAEFEARRPRMRAVAFRMLGSQADADDAVQEVWFRLRSTDHRRLDNLGGWLTTVVARICLDRLRSRRAKREVAFVADEPPHAPNAAAGSDTDAPEDQMLVAESLGAALLVVLDALGPSERVAFVLHDIFGVPFDEVATILDRSPDAARQLASRARRRVQGTARTADVDLPRQRIAVEAFLRAARAGDFTALLELLDPDVNVRLDAVAQRASALREVHGAIEVARAVSSAGGARAAQLALIDGVAGLVFTPGGHIRGLSQFTVVDGRITQIEVIGDADRIRAVDLVVLTEDI
jgi:RNA polymerase sigma-70 factor (ECF subfamily)